MDSVTSIESDQVNGTLDTSAQELDHMTAIGKEAESQTDSSAASVDGYFDADVLPPEDSQQHELDSSSLEASAISATPSSPSVVSHSTTIAQVLVPAQSTSSSRRLTPGWNMKGWLRSSSSASVLGRDSPRKSATQDATSLHTHLDLPALPMAQALANIRQGLEDSHNPSFDTIDWPFFTRVIELENCRADPDLRISIQRGLPGALRGLIWQSVMHSKNTELETVYAELLSEKSDYDRQIKKDVQRMSKLWMKSLEDLRFSQSI